MVRGHALLLAGVVGVAVASWFFGGDEVAPDKAAVGATEHEVAAHQRMRGEFHQRERRWTAALESGSASLRDVSQEMADYCEIYYPRYLSALQVMARGSSHLERVASNLVHCYELSAIADPENARKREIASRLRMQLQEWNQGVRSAAVPRNETGCP